jgi:hypothetical protein
MDTDKQLKTTVSTAGTLFVIFLWGVGVASYEVKKIFYK